MSKIAVMEKHHGEELQKAREYYRSDYVAVQLLKNACYLTVAYMIGLLLWGVANMDMLIEKLNRMQIKGILAGVIVSYLLCMTAGLLLTYVITMKRYFYGQELFRHYQLHLPPSYLLPLHPHYYWLYKKRSHKYLPKLHLRKSWHQQIH